MSSAAPAVIAPAWHSQPVVIEGKSLTFADVAGGALYHGTTAALPVGTLLVPGHRRNFAQSASDAVSITSNPLRAFTWGRQTVTDGEPVFVYKVVPEGPVQVWRASPANYGAQFMLWEGRVRAARIVGVVPVVAADGRLEVAPVE